MSPRAHEAGWAHAAVSVRGPAWLRDPSDVNALLAVDPDSAMDRLFRAVLCYNTGRTAQGLTDVEWVLDHKPPGIDLERVHQLRNLLAGGEQ